MNPEVEQILLKAFKAKSVHKTAQIQSLWSGYGQIFRIGVEGSNIKSAIVKHIVLPNQVNHPRGWNTNKSHQRKVKSYQVEANWYLNWASKCSDVCRVPQSYLSESVGDQQLIVLEDLDEAGFPIRKSRLNLTELQVCLRWLANFHATFLFSKPKGLWDVGTYWHLATRPDEFEVMEEGRLKEKAGEIDEILNTCEYQTIVHGDAKVANFCFSEDMNTVAAVDFQYVGGGCGMKDVVYLLGSCLTENECEENEKILLDYYFKELEIALDESSNNLNFNKLKYEWLVMYAIAWTDFTRFLLGWMPTHQKVNSYSDTLIKKTLANI